LLLQIFAALGLMFALLFFGVPELGEWFSWPFWQRALMLSTWVSAGAICYFVGLYVFGFRLGAFRSGMTSG